MARKVRSEATRRKMLDAAVEVFNEVGFAAADRGAIIEDGANLVVAELSTMSDSFSPALENILHGTFVTADLFATNTVVRTAEQLTLAFGKFNERARAAYAAWIQAMAAQTSRAIAEGDIRAELDPKTVSEAIIG